MKQGLLSMALPENGIERYLIKFKRTTSLPVLSSTVTELLRVIDSGDASAQDIERVISTDPALFTMLMRVAASYFPGNPPTSLRMAIMRVGQREIRSIAISLGIKRLIHEDRTSPFDVHRFAKHSLTVGFLSRYLFARRQKMDPFDSAWTADEMFAAGVLHDVGLPLLAKVAPEDYTRTELLARRLGVSFSKAFSRIYGCEIQELGAEVAHMWSLPSIFVETMRHMDAPWRLPNERASLSALSYADTLANRFGASLEEWKVNWTPILEAELEVGIPPEEEELLRPLVEQHVGGMLDNSDVGHVA